MKKKVLCMLLALCLFASFTLTSYAMLGPIDADDEAELISPTLEVATIPTGAVAVGRNLSSNDTYYYRVNGATISSQEEDLTVSGWMPEANLNAGEAEISPDAIVGDSDDRTRLYNANVAPYSAIGVVVAIFRDSDDTIYPYTGTGWLISKNVVVTAAHCLYSHEDGWPEQVVFVAGVNSAQLISSNFINEASNATEIAVSLPWYTLNISANSYDWGVIQLEQDLGLIKGYLGYKHMASNAANTTILSSGYPSDLNYGVFPDEKHPNATAYQYYEVGSVTSEGTGTVTVYGTVMDYRTYHTDLDATPGQSGAPILYYVDGAYHGIGIIREGNGTISNHATGITSQLFSFLLAYTTISQ